jgi:WD40 repeat protein
VRHRDGDAPPDGARIRLGTTRFRPGQGSLPPVFSPDGERILVEDSDSPPQVHVLEARTGRHLETLRSLSSELGRLLALCWTAEGIRVACQLYGGRPAVMEYPRARVCQLEANDPAWTDCAAFSADGERVAMVDAQGAVRVWNTGTGRMFARARPLSGTVGGAGVRKALAMSADGRCVAWSVGDARIHLYDVASRQLRPALTGHSEPVAELAFSPDGTRLASGAVMDEPLIRIWDVERGEAVMELPALGAPPSPGVFGAPCPSFAFIGPGARLAWLDGDALRTRDLATDAATSLPVGAVHSYGPLSASRDGTYVVAREGHALRAWNLETGDPDPARDSHFQPVRTVAVSPDGALAATSDDTGCVRIWDLAWGQGIGEIELSSARGCVRFSPDGRWLAVGTAEGQIHLWSRGEGRVLHSFPAHASHIEALVFSPDGWWLATCSGQGGDISVWSVPGGKRRRVLESGADRLTTLDYSPDGQWLVAGAMDGTIRFWSAPEGRRAHEAQAQDSSVHHVRFFPDSQRLLSVGLLNSDYPDDGPGQPMLHIWHAETGRLLTSRRARSHQLELSPDGRQLLYVPWRNPALCVEDAMTGEEPRTLVLVPEAESHGFSPDCSIWVTGHRDSTALVWDLTRWGFAPRPK